MKVSNFAWKDHLVVVSKGNSTASMMEVQGRSIFPVGVTYHFRSYPYRNAHTAVSLAVRLRHNTNA